LGTRGGDNAVEEEFGSRELSSLRGDIVGVVDLVAARGGSHALGFLFERTVSNNKFDVGDVFDSVLGNGGEMNELDGLGACGGVGCAAIGEATPFHGRGPVPEGTFTAAEEFPVLSWLVSVNVDGCVGLVGAGSKEDLQG